MLPFEPRWQPAPEPSLSKDNAPNESLTAAGLDAAGLTPSTILMSPGRPAIAIVQGRPCRIGDSILGVTLVGIAEQHVLYRSGNDTLTVQLPSPPLGGPR
jgi:hypothetical protein